MSTNWIKAIALADVPDEDVIAVQAGDRVRARTVAWTAGAGAHGASATGGGDAGSALTNAMGR